MRKVFNVWKLVIGVLFVICHLSFVISPIGAMGGPAPQNDFVAKEGVYIIDNFESGSLRTPREWWTFDISVAEVASNRSLKGGDLEVVEQVGNYSLLFKGTATNWYAGGAGAYIAKENQDLSKYNFFVMDIYGAGPGSGTVKIELFDDDNMNWQVEQDPAKNYATIYDDKYVYEVKVEWMGWKRLTIPLDDFVDDNPGVGDDIWNPEQADGSGGFLQIQLICLAGSDKGRINYYLDNLSLSVEEE